MSDAVENPGGTSTLQVAEVLEYGADMSVIESLKKANVPLDEILDEEQLSARYDGKPSIKTLRNWRAMRRGPNYIKIGGRTAYPLPWVLDWEKTRIR